MSWVNENTPTVVKERSFAFKTGILIFGALILLLSTVIRPNYPILWIPLFLLGVLIEWFIVALVYAEIEELERETSTSRLEIKATQEEIEETKSEIQAIQKEIESTKESIFSFASFSEGGTGDSIEDRVRDLEDMVGKGNASTRGNLKKRVKELERKFNRLDRNI